MNCPKCKDAPLKKSCKNAYTCERCSGVWFEDFEEADLALLSIGGPAAEAKSGANDKKTGLCPSGHGILIRAKVDLEATFYLEKCTSCGGIWFDKGEWLPIIENNLADHLLDFWSRSWQRKQSKDKDRNAFLALNRRLLGEQLFEKTMDLAEGLKGHPEKSRAIALLQQEIK